MVNSNPVDRIQISEFKPALKYSIEKIISHINNYGDTATSILEAGCGNRSILSRGLRKENKKLTIHGVDINEYALNNKDLDKVFIAPVEKMPFKDNSYDIIFTQFMLEHLENYQVALFEMLRVLNTDGILILFFPNPTSIEAIVTRLTPYWFHVLFRKYVHKQKKANRDTFPTYYSFRSVKNVRFFLEKNGCKKIEIKYFAETYYWFRYWRFFGKAALLYTKLISMLKITTLKSTVAVIAQK